MSGSYTGILAGVIAAFLLGYGVGWLFKAIRHVVEVAANVD